MAPQPLSVESNLEGLSPMAVHDVHLAKRAAYKVDPAKGVKAPNEFNNLGFQVLFALIGVGMVITALWFFFWAKNGGFKWRKGDWEDYKSTVLRRKGPDGKTLSNATKSTKLGGGSVVHGGSYGAASSVGYTDETGTSADLSEMREVEEGKSRRHFGLRGGEEKKKHRSRREHNNNYNDPELREYREERPARVGGINRQADGMYTDYSATEPSELGSNVSSRPLVKDKDKDKTPKDKKKEAKAKEQRAKERMKKAKLAEKEAAKNAAAEAKAQKEAEKAQREAEKAKAKKDKEEQKKEKKAKKTTRTETEATPSEAPEMTEVSAPTIISAPSEAPGPAARRGPPSAAYSFTTGDDQTVYTGVYTENRSAPSVYTENRTAPSEGIPESSYYSDYRPNADRSAYSRSRSANNQNRESRSRSRPTSQSPRKHHRTSRQSAAPSDIFTQANGEVQGTISYPCYIPGLSSAGSVGVSESVSQVGGPSSREKRQRDVMDGYRRGGVRAVGRRDSLSDSDA